MNILIEDLPSNLPQYLVSEIQRVPLLGIWKEYKEEQGVKKQLEAQMAEQLEAQMAGRPEEQVTERPEVREQQVVHRHHQIHHHQITEVREDNECPDVNGELRN
jgi:hypothetical protein